MWQFSNPREVEKIVEVEVPFEAEPRHRFERFLIKGSEHFSVQFGDGDTSPEFYEFIHGTLSLTDVTFTGEWATEVTFILCEIRNSTFDLTNIDVILENCTVQDSSFEGTFDSAVYLRGTSFTGVTTFNISVVNGTGNTGLENVVFEGQVFQED